MPSLLSQAAQGNEKSQKKDRPILALVSFWCRDLALMLAGATIAGVMVDNVNLTSIALTAMLASFVLGQVLRKMSGFFD